jgi:hypothetical protein
MTSTLNHPNSTKPGSYYHPPNIYCCYLHSSKTIFLLAIAMFCARKRETRQQHHDTQQPSRSSFLIPISRIHPTKSRSLASKQCYLSRVEVRCQADGHRLPSCSTTPPTPKASTPIDIGVAPRGPKDSSPEEEKSMHKQAKKQQLTKNLNKTNPISVFALS